MIIINENGEESCVKTVFLPILDEIRSYKRGEKADE